MSMLKTCEHGFFSSHVVIRTIATDPDVLIGGETCWGGTKPTVKDLEEELDRRRTSSDWIPTFVTVEDDE